MVVRRRRVVAVLGLPVAVLTALAPSVASQASPRVTHHPVSFGAKLTTQSQPSNAFGGQPCQSQVEPCSRVMVAAYRRPDPQTDVYAPKKGTIGKIEIVAGVPGVFKLQIVRARPGQQKARLVRNGPVIHYDGQGTGDEDNGPPYSIETFKVNVPVEKGDYLAVQSKEISFEYCSGGGLNQITFEPPLVHSSTFRHTSHQDGCLMLLEAVYKPGT